MRPRDLLLHTTSKTYLWAVRWLDEAPKEYSFQPILVRFNYRENNDCVKTSIYVRSNGVHTHGGVSTVLSLELTTDQFSPQSCHKLQGSAHGVSCLLLRRTNGKPKLYVSSTLLNIGLFHNHIAHRRMRDVKVVMTEGKEVANLLPVIHLKSSSTRG